MNWTNIRYFKPNEFACKHCKQQTEMDWNLIHALDWIREIFGVPFIVTSGYRCEEHNKAVGGAPKSFHVQGKAADISVKRKGLLQPIFKVAVLCKKFNGVGISDGNFIHFDTGTRTRPYYYVYLPAGGNKPVNSDVLREIMSQNIEDIIGEFKV